MGPMGPTGKKLYYQVTPFFDLKRFTETPRMVFTTQLLTKLFKEVVGMVVNFKKKLW